MAQFSDFSLDKRLLKTLERAGYAEPTPVQAQTIEAALKGCDLLVCAETGSGKTAAFLLPILQQLLAKDAPNTGTRALILAPTRELARQIEKNTKALAAMTHLQVGLITGGSEFKVQKALLRKNPEIVIATPGRLLELIGAGATDLADLEVLVLDEADRMLDMGLSEDVIKIAEACNAERQTLLYSATLSRRGLGSVAAHVLKEPETIEVNSARDQQHHIEQLRVLCDDASHKQKVLSTLLGKETYQKALVFANTKTQVDALRGYLQYKGFRAGVLHGDMTQDERNYVMDRFRRGHFDVLAATDVAARGLDIKGVELVINFDLARNPEDYIHRIGRTGRAGETGRAISFIGPYDWNLMVRIEHFTGKRMEPLTVAGLIAKFKGPAKLKSSGKAAGSKKKKLDKKAAKKNGSPKKGEGSKGRHRDKKNIGKRRAASDKPGASKFGDGFAPAPIKKK